MFMGLGMPIPDLSNKPGPGRPGFATGAYEFQFEVDGQVTFKADAAAGGGSFTVQWPNGSSQSYSGSNASITAPDATAGIVAINNKLDTGYCDEFAVTSGKDKVKKVISWGERPWRDLSFAFSSCPNLTNIENTKLIGAANCNIEYLFFNCTGLTEALCENWDLSLGCEMRYLFESCTNLELLNLTGSKLPGSSTASSNYSFHEVGSTTTNGCEFKMSGLDFTGTINAPGRQWFKLAKFKAGSNLSNWTFDSALNSFYATDLFASATVNGTLDVSNWNWPSQQFPSFNSVNGSLTSRNGSKIKLTNFDVSKVNNFASAFVSCKVNELEGLSTWGACAGNATIFRMFSGATLMAFNASDNFSNTFIASLTPTYVNEAFYNFSSALPDSDFGPCPNLNGLDCSSLTSASTNGFLRFMRNSRWNNVPDFSNTTFSSTDTVSFEEAFRLFKTTGTGSNSIFNFNPTTIKPANFNSSWRSAGGVTEVNIGSNVDMSSMTSVNAMLYAINYSSTATPFTNATFPTTADFSSLTDFGNFVNFAQQVLSVCQMDNFIRRLRATNDNSNITVDFHSCKITEAPALVRSDIDYFTNTKSWNITLATPDATLPFAYANYAVDPTGITTISPTTTPPAGSVFTATNGLSISASGVITIGSFRGSSTIRCTYPDGCYNEVTMLIQVPFVMRIVIPSSGSTTPFTFKPQMSAGECFIDWGDTTETLTGNTTHNYPAAGSDTTYDIKVFDSPSGSKFTGMSGAFQVNESAAIDKSIMQWGEIEWQNNIWFSAPSHNQNKLRISAPNGAAHKPNLSQVTSLQNMFGVGSKGPNQVFEDVNNNLADWDVSTITNMQQMFNVSGAPVNRPSDGQPNTLQLSNWDVSNVTNFSSFGYGALLTANGVYVNYLGFDMTNWDTSAATNMAGMFYARGTLIGVENFNTSNVTDMNNMFSGRPVTGIDFKTKLVNGTVRWSVKKVADFSNMFRGYSGSGSNGGGVTNSTFPTNWWISGEGQDVNMFGMYGNNRFNPGRFQALTDNDAFATKTIAVNDSPYGSSYTAWDMSNTTSVAQFAYSGQPANMQNKNWNISSWQISDKCTTLNSMLTIYSTLTVADIYTSLDQDLGHWDISNVTAINDWMTNTRYNPPYSTVNFSTNNYDSLLSITDGWGQHASSAQSGVSLNMGTSQYNPGISIEGSTNGVGTATTIYDSTKNFTTEGNNGNIAVGDILYNKDTNQYSKVLSFSTYTVVTDQSIWGSSGVNYRVENSNAARGKIALISAGWTITDGGAYIPPVVPMQLQFTVASNTQTTIEIPYVQGTSFTIDWGDGFTETSAGSNNRTVSHTYNDGTNTNVTNPTVSINAQGDASPMTGFDFGQGGSKTLLIDIPAWGNTPFTRFRQLLHGCSNLNTLSATDAPILSGVTNFYAAFFGTGTMGNADFTSWDISSATYMGYMFQSSQFNGNISSWDVSNVTNMAYMFQNTVFTGDLTNWDVSNVATSNHMFNGGSSNPDIAGWDMAAANNQYFWAWSNTAFNPSPFLIGHTVANQNWKYMNNHSAWTTNNWTDFLVLNANAANARSPKTPIGADFTSNSTGYRTVDTTRTYSGTGFPNAGRAISFLSADVTVSGGSSAFNGVYGYNYTTQKWVKDGDTTKTIEWNATESMWEVLNSGVSQYEGTGGTQGNGPESSTSWTGGITVVDSSLGWTLFTSIIS